MTIQKTRVEADNGENFYIVTFDDHAERNFWLIRNGFRYAPLEGRAARWVSSHNGGDYAHTLELVPFAPEHINNLRALCMKCYLHPRSAANDKLRDFDNIRKGNPCYE